MTFWALTLPSFAAEFSNPISPASMGMPFFSLKVRVFTIASTWGLSLAGCSCPKI